jgi:general secretion pathway protein I
VRTAHARGFTLIEVLVALFIVALGIGALLTTLTSAATTIDHLRDKSFAEWVALNRITEARLAGTAGATGVTNGEVEYAGTRWYWRQEVVDQGQAGMRRIEVAVSRTASAEAAPLASAVGFMGFNLQRPSGKYPAWTLEILPDKSGGDGKKPPGESGKAR